MSKTKTYDALVELRQRNLGFEVDETVVEELNAILDEAGDSGSKFKIPWERLREQTVAITAGEEEKRTGRLIINRPDFQKKLDAMLAFYKPDIGFTR
jgi:hypothetical protein